MPRKGIRQEEACGIGVPANKGKPEGKPHVTLKMFRCHDGFPSGLGLCGLYAATQSEQTLKRFQGRGADSRSSELPIASAELPDLQLPATPCQPSVSD
jgi:hypothetical protein